MVMEPKDYAFRRWLNIPIIIWEYDWMPWDKWSFQGLYKCPNHFWDQSSSLWLKKLVEEPGEKIHRKRTHSGKLNGIPLTLKQTFALSECHTQTLNMVNVGKYTVFGDKISIPYVGVRIVTSMSSLDGRFPDPKFSEQMVAIAWGWVKHRLLFVHWLGFA